MNRLNCLNLVKHVPYTPLGLGLALFIFAAACTPFQNALSGGRMLPGQGVPLRMGQATWDTGWFQAQVFKLLLEDLGYEVREPETLDTIAFYFFAAQGDVDFWANGWFPLHSRYFDYRQVAGEIEAIGFQVEGGALQGYMVDKATAEELGITNLGDLQDPDIAAAFDSDGDGKANLIGCNVGWGCERVIDHHLNAYGLQDTVTHVKSDYSALMADTVSRYQDGQPVLFYTWTPNWTVSELVIGEDVAWLGVPFSSLPDDLDADTGADSISGCLESPCDMGFGPNDIRVVANVDFLEENPAAATLFNLVEIPLEDIAAQNSLMRAGENTEEDIRRHAQAWIEANHDQIARWLAAARDAAE